ncbi:MAG: redoxin domain-containing protein, partial [Acidobacteria bacterium]|nr:redoxin domain-containing protein [Acidobacteriota bacterium]
MNPRSIALFASILVAAGSGVAEAGGVKVGKPAPELKVKWVQPADGAAGSWGELRGKYVVLEFWTTWCAPCVAAIPDLNELAEKFEGRAQFISVSNEDAAVVKEFLSDKPIAGWVGLDSDGSIWKGFGVEGIPHTVLIGPDGNVLAETRPEGFTEEMLEAVVAGKIAEVREKLPKASGTIDAFAGMRSPDSSEALLEAWIRPHQESTVMGVKRSNNEIWMRGMTLREIVGNGMGFPFERVVLPEGMAGQSFDMVVRIPESRAEMLKAVLRQTLEVGLGLQFLHETREAEVWVLTAPQGRTAALREPVAKGGSATRWAGGMLEGRYSAMRDLDILIDLSRRIGLRTDFGSAGDVMREIASVT